MNLEYRESEVSPEKTQVKQGKFVEFISPVKGCFRETYKSQHINPISPTLSSPCASYRSKLKVYQLVFSA